MISNLIDTLFGCSHKRMSFPITVHAHSHDATETYTVCLDCGQEFDYDWKAMKVMGRREQAPVLAKAAIAKAA